MLGALRNTSPRRFHVVRPKHFSTSPPLRQKPGEHETEALELDDNGNVIKKPTKDDAAKAELRNAVRDAWETAKKEAAEQAAKQQLERQATQKPDETLEWSNLRQKAEQSAQARAQEDTTPKDTKRAPPPPQGPRGTWERVRKEVTSGPKMTKKDWWKMFRTELVPLALLVVTLGLVFRLLKSWSDHNNDVREYRVLIEEMREESNQVLSVKSRQWNNDKEAVLNGLDSKKKEQVSKYIDEVLLQPTPLPEMPDRRHKEPTGPIRFF